MKKWIKMLILLLAIIYIMPSLKIYASNDVWEYEWYNTVVNVKLGDEISKYIKIPYAKLYKNGEELKDAYLNYLTDGDWLYYLKDVDTTTPGTYYVWYKAFENKKYIPGTAHGYKCKITFVINDDEAPKIDIINSNIYVQRKKDNDLDLINELLNNNVNVSDNYSICDIRFEQNIKLNVVGRYKVIVSAIDEAKNRSSGHFYVEVFDESKPTIFSELSDNYLKITKNSDLDLKRYFYAYDDVDGDISKNISITPFNNNKIGKYDVYVNAYNSSGNQAQLKIIVEVCDDTPPKIYLQANQVVLDYLEDFSSFDFNKYVINITDDEEIDYSKLVVTHNLENKIGNYYIKYSYNDGINEDVVKIDVRLVSFKSPTLEIIDAEIEQGQNVDLNQYVYVFDESDNYVSESVKIDDSNVDYNKSGIYFADVYCVNSSGQSNTKKMKIKITSNKETTINKDFILIYSILGGILVSGISVTAILLIKKQRKKKKNER